MAKISAFTTHVPLILCHVAGVLVIVILPLWVGGLIGAYGIDPQMAGGLVTLYLLGIVLSNLMLAFRFDLLPARTTMFFGFAVPAAVFFLIAFLRPGATETMIPIMAGLHVLGGLGAGAGMAVVHGRIGRSPNPHRLFAFANLGVGLFGIMYFTITPPMMSHIGVKAVFLNAGATILVAALSTLFVSTPLQRNAFVQSNPEALANGQSAPAGIPVLAACFLGVVLLQLGNAVSISFVERLGNFRGYSANDIGLMLAVGGIVALMAPVAATILEKRISPLRVVVLGMSVHGILSLVLFNSGAFGPYAIAYALGTATVLFTHTFAFGLLAHYDPTGRMNALTTTMMMSGSALGPILGGTIAKHVGFPQIGMAAAACAFAGAICYVAVARMRPARA